MRHRRFCTSLCTSAFTRSGLSAVPCTCTRGFRKETPGSGRAEAAKSRTGAASIAWREARARHFESVMLLLLATYSKLAEPKPAKESRGSGLRPLSCLGSSRCGLRKILNGIVKCDDLLLRSSQRNLAL